MAEDTFSTRITQLQPIHVDMNTLEIPTISSVTLKPVDQVMRAISGRFREGNYNGSAYEIALGLAIISLAKKLQPDSPHWGSALYMYILHFRGPCNPYVNFDARAYATMLLPADNILPGHDIVTGGLRPLRIKSATEDPVWVEGVHPTQFDLIMVGLLRNQVHGAHSELEEVYFASLLLACGETGILATAYPDLVEISLATLSSGGGLDKELHVG